MGGGRSVGVGVRGRVGGGKVGVKGDEGCGWGVWQGGGATGRADWWGGYYVRGRDGRRRGSGPEGVVVVLTNERDGDGCNGSSGLGHGVGALQPEEVSGKGEDLDCDVKCAP